MAYFFIFNSSLNYEELVIIISTKITASWIIKKYLQASILGEMPWISAKIIFIMSIWAKRVDIRTDRDKEGINRWFWRQAVVKVWKFPPWRPYEINENRWVKHNGWVKHNSSTILLLMKNYLYRTIISWAISNARYIYIVLRVVLHAYSKHQSRLRKALNRAIWYCQYLLDWNIALAQMLNMF